MATAQFQLPLPVLPTGWAGEKDFKAVHSLSAPVHREIEPVGPHFLAHARRKRHKRTFSEDERIQAAENVKKVEDTDDGDISETEDPLMLQRDAKDWKVELHRLCISKNVLKFVLGTRSLRCSWSVQIPLQGH
jgi:DnaJ family protein C protein 2